MVCIGVWVDPPPPLSLWLRGENNVDSCDKCNKSLPLFHSFSTVECFEVFFGSLHESIMFSQERKPQGGGGLLVNVHITQTS